MFDKYTESARRTLFFARYEASQQAALSGRSVPNRRNASRPNGGERICS